MEKRATITLREKATESPVLVTEGTVVRIGDTWNVRYRDKEARYTIGVSEGMVTITREGEEDYTLILQEGKMHSFDITSPFGELPLTVTPKAVKTNVSDNGLKVRVAYEISSGDVSKKFRLYLDCLFDGD